MFKQRLFVSDVGVNEINEGGGGDECKFVIWSRRSSSLPDGKIILKVGMLASGCALCCCVCLTPFHDWTLLLPLLKYLLIYCRGFNFKASSSETKNAWVRKMKEVVQESCLNSALPLNLDPLPKSPLKVRSAAQRTSRWVDTLYYIIYLSIIVISRISPPSISSL